MHVCNKYCGSGESVEVRENYRSGSLNITFEHQEDLPHYFDRSSWSTGLQMVSCGRYLFALDRLTRARGYLSKPRAWIRWPSEETIFLIQQGPSIAQSFPGRAEGSLGTTMKTSSGAKKSSRATQKSKKARLNREKLEEEARATPSASAVSGALNEPERAGEDQQQVSLPEEPAQQSDGRDMFMPRSLNGHQAQLSPSQPLPPNPPLTHLPMDETPPSWRWSFWTIPSSILLTNLGPSRLEIKTTEDETMLDDEEHQTSPDTASPFHKANPSTSAGILNLRKKLRKKEASVDLSNYAPAQVSLPVEVKFRSSDIREGIREREAENLRRRHQANLAFEDTERVLTIRLPEGFQLEDVERDEEWYADITQQKVIIEDSEITLKRTLAGSLLWFDR